MPLSFPDLTANDIEVRVSRCNGSVIDLLLYKDARCDMRILDETIGAENWQRKHETIDGVMFCSVGIKVPRDDGFEWVWKQDCGTAGNFEAEKSKASDAFKRACFNWGIGRELYTAPQMAIWWNPQDGQPSCNVKQNDKGQWVCYDHFSVSQIIIEDKTIKALSVRNDTTGRIVFRIDLRSE